MRRRIGDCLVQAGVISDQDLRVALVEHKQTGDRIGSVLLRRRLIAEWQLARALAAQLGLPYANLLADPPDPNAVALIPRDLASKRVSIGTQIDDARLTVAMADPLLFGLIKDLEARTGRRIRPVVATRTSILRAIHAGYALKARQARQAGLHVPDCGRCRRSLEPEWQFCPFCAARIGPVRLQAGPLPDAAGL